MEAPDDTMNHAARHEQPAATETDVVAQHLKRISVPEPAPAMLSDQSPDVSVQLVQPGHEDLQTPRPQDVNRTYNPSADSTPSPPDDYFSGAIALSDAGSPQAPLTARRRSVKLDPPSIPSLRPAVSPELHTSSNTPLRADSALARSLAAQRDAITAASAKTGASMADPLDESIIAPRLQPRRSLTEYSASSIEPVRQSPDSYRSSSRSIDNRRRPANLESLRGPSAERQLHTTGNTPLHTPHLFSPQAIRPKSSKVPAAHAPGAIASPYLHPTQTHQPQAPIETSKVTREVDVFSGRKLINQYQIIKELGKGTHGKVKLASYPDANNETKFVAIKIVSRHPKRKRLGKADTSQEDKVKKEIAILKKVIHRNVVSMIEVIDDPEIHKVYLVLEFCEQSHVRWRTPGESEILLMEHRRLLREKQGDLVMDVPQESDKILRAAVRRRERAAKRRTPLSRINSQENFCWSLEYAGDSEDEEDALQSESASCSMSRISTRPPMPIRPVKSQEQASEHESLSPTDTRFLELQSHETNDEARDAVPLDVPDHAQSWDMRDLHSHLQDRMAKLEESVDVSNRKVSIAESSFSRLTEMMESEIIDEERRYVPLLTLAEARRAFRDALLGLEYLHYHGIVHRDIKPENLLRKADYSVKISDFGVSYLGKPQRDGRESEDTSENEGPDHEEETELAKTVGTPAFYAPELCILDFPGDRPRVTPQIDVWALGVVLYCLVYARLPFEASNEFVMMRCIAEEEVKFSRQRLKAVDETSRAAGSHSPAFRSPYHRLPHELAYDEIDDDLQDLLRRLLEKDPMKRITVKEIKHHPWILRDIPNPAAWQEETDPARFNQGKKIEISSAEVNDAVIPLKILDRAKSVAKKIGGVLGLSATRSGRRRGQSSANSSDVGSTTSSGHSAAGAPGPRKSSFHSDDGQFTSKPLKDAIYATSHQEHPLSQSVTASPDIEKANQSFEQAFQSQHSSADSFADLETRPPLAGRQQSSMSTAGSIKTIRQSDIPAKPSERVGNVFEEHPTHNNHRDILSATSLGALFGGAGRSIMRTMSRSRRGSESGSRTSSRPPSPKLRESHGSGQVHGHGKGHGEPSTAVSNASAAGMLQKPSASPSPDSKRTSMIGGVPPSALPHAVQEAAARRGSPLIGSPTDSRASPTPMEHGAEVSDAEYNEIRQQLIRRRLLEETRARERSRPASALSDMPCPPSPDDMETPNSSTQRSPTASGFLSLSTTADLPSPRPREPSMKPISSNSSEDRFNSGISQSTSYPSIPSVVSADSSIQADYSTDHFRKGDVQTSDPITNADWQTVSHGPMATPTGPLVLTEARKQAFDERNHSAIDSDNEASDSSDEFLVMGKSKAKQTPMAPGRRPSSNNATSRRDSSRRERRVSNTTNSGPQASSHA